MMMVTPGPGLWAPEKSFIWPNSETWQTIEMIEAVNNETVQPRWEMSRYFNPTPVTSINIQPRKVKSTFIRSPSLSPGLAKSCLIIRQKSRVHYIFIFIEEHQIYIINKTTYSPSTATTHLWIVDRIVRGNFMLSRNIIWDLELVRASARSTGRSGTIFRLWSSFTLDLI